MKVQRKKNKKLLPIIIIGLTIVLVALGIFFLIKHNSDSSTKIPSDNKDATEIKNDLDTKQNLIKDPNAQDAPTSPTLNANSITITSTQTATDVTILTKLGNVASGSCNLTITNSGKTYTDTAPVIYQSQFSSCAGFTVSKNNLNGSGTWDVTLTINSDQSSVTKTATIEVN